MKERIISGLIMVPLLLIFYFRGVPLILAAIVISMMSVYEFLRGFSKIGIRGNLYVAWGALAVLYILHYFFPGRLDILSFWLFASIVVSFISIFAIDKHKAEDAMATVLAIVYLEFFSYHIVLIDDTSYGSLVWMVGITAFCTDVAAYFVGMFFGKNKLAPVLSPKKTVEGAVGGVIGAIIGSVIFALIVKMDIFPHIIIMAILGSITSQIGDLTASAFKRKMEIKDYGNLIPGHGGALDRFDSIIFTAPVIYYYLILFVQK